MVCIVCFGEECQFAFMCNFHHDATCTECLKVFLKMNVHHIFQNNPFQCTFCYQPVSTIETDEDGILSLKTIRLRNFGLNQKQILLPLKEIQRHINYAVDHYAFDILKGIALMSSRVINESELFNAFEFFQGLREMIRRIRFSLRRPFTVENMKRAEISMIESSIIIITNELNALDALYPVSLELQRVVPEHVEDGIGEEHVEGSNATEDQEAQEEVKHSGRKRKWDEFAVDYLEY